MPTYTYRCSSCNGTREQFHTIAEHENAEPPTCVSCSFAMRRAYGVDAPQPAPMWPEHLNPTTGTVVRSRTQLQSDMDRQAGALFERTGIEQRPVVVDRADMPSIQGPATS